MRHSTPGAGSKRCPGTPSPARCGTSRQHSTRHAPMITRSAHRRSPACAHTRQHQLPARSTAAVVAERDHGGLRHPGGLRHRPGNRDRRRRTPTMRRRTPPSVESRSALRHARRRKNPARGDVGTDGGSAGLLAGPADRPADRPLLHQHAPGHDDHAGPAASRRRVRLRRRLVRATQRRKSSVIQPWVSANLPRWIPVRVSRSARVTSPGVPSPIE